MNMNINSALSSAGSADIIQQTIGIAMLNKVKALQTSQVDSLLKDLQSAPAAPAPHPHLGNHLDIRI